MKRSLLSFQVIGGGGRALQCRSLFTRPVWVKARTKFSFEQIARAPFVCAAKALPVFVFQSFSIFIETSAGFVLFRATSSKCYTPNWMCSLETIL